MKKALLTLATVIAMGVSAFGQGTITFYNNGIARPFTTDAAGNRTYTYDPAVNGTQPNDPTKAGPAHPLVSADGTTYRAGVFLPGGTVGAGAAYTAGLFLTSALAADPNAAPLASTPFRGNNTFEVFANNVPVIVPNAPVGSSQNFTVRVWQTGSTYATSATRGEAAFTSGPLGGPVAGNPDAAPASLLGFNGFTLVVPEPSTIALAAFGIGALGLLRRRK